MMWSTDQSDIHSPFYRSIRINVDRMHAIDRRNTGRAVPQVNYAINTSAIVYNNVGNMLVLREFLRSAQSEVRVKPVSCLQCPHAAGITDICIGNVRHTRGLDEEKKHELHIKHITP